MSCETSARVLDRLSGWHQRAEAFSHGLNILLYRSSFMDVNTKTATRNETTSSHLRHLKKKGGILRRFELTNQVTDPEPGFCNASPRS